MFTENLNDFFYDFAVPATWQSQTVQVIFDEAYQDGSGMAGVAPMAQAKAADMPGVKRNQAIVINGKNYVIAQPPRPDGQGMLQLELANA